MTGLPSAALVAVFLIAAAAVWLAGIRLSTATDVLSERLGFGEALGGLLLLAIATNLPEIAITASAALAHDLSIAVGNILGGIAIQTVVLVALDAFGAPRGRPLTYRAASLELVLECALVISILVAVVMGTRLPASLVAFRIAPEDVAIVALWGVGLLLLRRATRGLPWHEAGEAPDNQEAPRGHSKARTEREATERSLSTVRAGVVFAVAAVVTLIGGIALERSGEELSTRLGLSGVLFGATILAAATALPEISTGLASVRMGDDQLAMSDIFGGNAFLPVLFLFATVLSGTPVLPQAQDTDVYLTALGALLTAVYLAGLIFRPTVRIARMGVDSLAVVVLYVLGIAGLIAIATR